MTTPVELVRRFRRLRALIIGDAMLDTYLEGTAARLCSEGPVPVVRKTAEHRAPGGAANTAANLRALGADVTFLGVVGRDIAGSLLRSTLREHGVADRLLIEDATASTLHKMRILADGQYVVRFDDGEASYNSEANRQRLIAGLEETFPQCDVIVVSDYGYGVASQELIDRLRTLLAAQPRVLLVDSKELQRFYDVGATVVTPNHLEAQFLVEHGRVANPLVFKGGVDRDAIAAIGRQLLTLINAQHAAITMASEGVFLIDRNGTGLHLPAHPAAAVPTGGDVGAGDSFSAAMALALAAGASPADAARIGIEAAGIAVTKRFTTVVQQRELLQRVSLREHASYLQARVPATEAGTRRAMARLMAQLAAEREAGRTIVFTNGIFDILQAGHVTFLRQAKALGDILVVGVNSDRSVRRLKGAHQPINNERDRLALVAALEPVDHVVLFDADTAAALIRALRPHIYVKGGDYEGETVPEAEAVREAGARSIILPLAGSLDASRVIDRIIALATPEVNR
jgi:D-beta-D-heptose 7-phosphate kinase/D-beta-D-heptose 1-phosphate adenosyltransferase